ncbi:sensor histidine kinase [Flavitalea antarctica]
MRSFLPFILCILCIATGWCVHAQSLSPIRFHGQPILTNGIPVKPHALFYENFTGDTTQPLDEINKSRFISGASMAGTEFINNRQMKRTSQVVWLQFLVSNSHPIDTLRLWYRGGVHAYLSLYKKSGSSLDVLSHAGMCSVGQSVHLDPYSMRLEIPPLSTNHYFVRVADYLLLFDDIAGSIHTNETYQSNLLDEANNAKWLAFVMAMIIGCLTLMSMHSFYQYYLNGDKSFLYYAIYAAFASLWILKFANPRFNLGLTPVSLPWLAHPWSFSFSHILALAYALFLTRLLAIPAQQPRLWRIIRPLKWLLVILQVMVVIQFFTGILVSGAAMFFLIDSLPSLCMGILLIIATLRSQSRLKPYLLVGEISLYVISLSPVHGIFLLGNASPQIASFINYPPFFMALGLFVELFCFSLALAYRNKLVEVEKTNLQESYTSQLENELLERSKEIKHQSRILEEQHTSQLRSTYERKLATMEMTALRAQMNPHFIFNCLNSIKLYTTDNEVSKANTYLTKFSRLIRLVLENSRSEKVTLKNELEALQLYLEMEAMRFKDKLKFDIQVGTNVETDAIEIPPMLFQPYVENAIWHGLMQKKAGGNVGIKVLQYEVDCLHVTITDDGIGRTRAAELKSKSAIAKKSFGMEVTNERIALINQLYQTNTKVVVNDLIDCEGNAAGTEVVLHILL